VTHDPHAAHSPRWHRRPEARPEEILAAATEVFGARGYRAARLEEIARHAGVSKGTLYLYFDSKDTLFREVVRNTIVPLVVEGEAFVASHDGPTGALLEALVRRLWGEMSQPARLRMVRVVIGELGNFPELSRFYFEEVVLRGRNLVRAILDRGLARGDVRPGVTAAAAHGLPAMLLQVLLSRFVFAPHDPDPLADEALLAGLIALMQQGVLVPCR